ncbi:MAG: LamG domain-containing protein, partial [Candidatus Marinimicrobia bacterium]|nr:LamG domain-containing protein [Candidatus Neomarinimicrobiota bacterium]
GATYSVGKIGGALSFNGTAGPNVNLGTPSTLKNISTGNFTIEAWVKTSDISSRGAIFGSCCDYYPAVNFEINASGNGSMRYWHNDGSATDSWYGNRTGLNDGNWHHVVMVRDKTNSKGRIYVDGALDKENAIVAANGAIAATSIRLGTDNRLNADITHNGLIDQVRVYNYARTPAQIAWDYNHGAPIAHYKMDKGEGTTIYDSSGNGNHGTIYGDTYYVSGKQNYALSFDGTDDYVDCGTTTTRNLGITREISIAAWVYVRGGNNLLQKGGSSESTTDVFEIHNMDGTPYTILGFETTGRWETVSSVNFPQNSWHHFVSTYDGDRVKQYVDGVLTHDVDAPNENLRDNSEKLTIGAEWEGSPVTELNGQIDDVRIYNYALTADQVKTVYNFGAAKFGTGD